VRNGFPITAFRFRETGFYVVPSVPKRDTLRVLVLSFYNTVWPNSNHTHTSNALAQTHRSPPGNLEVLTLPAGRKFTKTTAHSTPELRERTTAYIL
jgi:hypothetical protein